MPHTPGPWRRGTETRRDPYYVEVVSDSVVAGVATVFGKDRETQEANCSLIVAAPELLDAARRIVDGYLCSRGEIFGEDVRRLEKAIAKATSHNGNESVN